MADISDYSVDQNPDITEWDEFVIDHATGPSMALSNWRDVISQCFNVKTLMIAVRGKSGKIEGLMSGYHLACPGRILYSVPHGFIAKNQDAANALASAVKSYCRDAELVATVITSGFEKYQLPGSEWTKTSFLVKPQKEEHDAWKALPGKARTTIRKAKSHNIELSTDPGKFLEFQQVYASRLLSKGVTAKSPSFFEALREIGDDRIKLYTGAQDGRIIAGAVFYFDGQTAAYLFNGCIGEKMATGINSVLLWEAFKDAGRLGYNQIELGESSEGSGVYKFKTKQIGGVPTEIFYYDLMNETGETRAPVKLIAEEYLHALVERLPLPVPNPIKRALSYRRSAFGKIL